MPCFADVDTWNRTVSELPVFSVVDVDSETPLGIPEADKLTSWPAPVETVDVNVDCNVPPKAVVPAVGDKLKT